LFGGIVAITAAGVIASTVVAALRRAWVVAALITACVITVKVTRGKRKNENCKREQNCQQFFFGFHDFSPFVYLIYI
jgi:hypothetical protein